MAQTIILLDCQDDASSETCAAIRRYLRHKSETEERSARFEVIEEEGARPLARRDSGTVGPPVRPDSEGSAPLCVVLSSPSPIHQASLFRRLLDKRPAACVVFCSQTPSEVYNHKLENWAIAHLCAWLSVVSGPGTDPPAKGINPEGIPVAGSLKELWNCLTSFNANPQRVSFMQWIEAARKYGRDWGLIDLLELSANRMSRVLAGVAPGHPPATEDPAQDLLLSFVARCRGKARPLPVEEGLLQVCVHDDSDSARDGKARADLAAHLRQSVREVCDEYGNPLTFCRDVAELGSSSGFLLFCHVKDMARAQEWIGMREGQVIFYSAGGTTQLYALDPFVATARIYGRTFWGLNKWTKHLRKFKESEIAYFSPRQMPHLVLALSILCATYLHLQNGPKYSQKSRHNLESSNSWKTSEIAEYVELFETERANLKKLPLCEPISSELERTVSSATVPKGGAKNLYNRIKDYCFPFRRKCADAAYTRGDV